MDHQKIAFFVRIDSRGKTKIRFDPTNQRAKRRKQKRRGCQL